jgi:hypothetical protein
VKSKTRFTWLTLAAILCLLTAAPASASTLYDNGLVNGTIGAWTIALSSPGENEISDSFTLGSASTLTGAQIGLWLFHGDTATNVDWSIGTTSFGSNIGSGTAAVLTGTFQYTSALGFDIYESTFSLSGALAAGTYYLTLENLVVSNGDLGYWDETDGPSAAFGNIAPISSPPMIGNLNQVCGTPGYPGTLGASCSESFQIYGTTPTTTPEPASWVLLGSSILIFAGLMHKFTS